MEVAGTDRIKELEEQVASLTKQNSKLKNELKFTTDTERCVDRGWGLSSKLVLH